MSSGQDTKDAKEPLFLQIFQLNVKTGPILNQALQKL